MIFSANKALTGSGRILTRDELSCAERRRAQGSVLQAHAFIEPKGGVVPVVDHQCRRPVNLQRLSDEKVADLPPKSLLACPRMYGDAGQKANRWCAPGERTHSRQPTSAVPYTRPPLDAGYPWPRVGVREARFDKQLNLSECAGRKPCGCAVGRRAVTCEALPIHPTEGADRCQPWDLSDEYVDQGAVAKWPVGRTHLGQHPTYQRDRSIGGSPYRQSVPRGEGRSSNDYGTPIATRPRPAAPIQALRCPHAQRVAIATSFQVLAATDLPHSSILARRRRP